MNSQEYHRILDYLRRLIESTQWESHVYAVGGCCRDEIMGEPIKDIDLAVDLPGGGIGFAEWLHGRRLIENEPVTYPKFGTAMVVLKQFPDVELELVQTRREKYSDRNSRCPETAFGSIEEDCLRRDLTVNSIFYNITTGKTVDITGCGQADIERQLLRTPADPDVTFDDDPVRILRCIRFAARFGWTIDHATYEGMCRNVERLRIVSPRRLRMELEKMLMSPRPALALTLLRDTGAMPYIMPALAAIYDLPTRYENHTVWQHTLKTVTLVPDDIRLRWAALLLDAGKGVPVSSDPKKGRQPHDLESRRIVWRILPRLRYDEDVIEDVAFLVRYHTFFKGSGPDGEKLSDVRMRKIQYQSGTPERFEMLLKLVEADNLAYPDAASLAGQTEGIRRHSVRLVADGTAMFGYRLPVSVQKLRRIIRARTAKQVREARDYLLSLAYENPLLTAEDMEKRLAKLKSSDKSRQKSNKTPNNGGKNRPNVEKRSRR
ncbi:MAG: hypothetical protein HDS56_06050 [Barnesiella sp.]|nr:hypothetical protein [Barnesiella sp.]MBD5343861.1 hypothetical protein [Bacteroides sp.]